VALFDAQAGAAEAAREAIARLLGDLAAQGLLNGQTPDEVAARIRPSNRLADALAGAVHVQENVPERLEVKRAVFRSLGESAPADAVLASSTSALLPSAFTAEVAGRERCLVAHPINPPYLVPAVELVPAPWTSDAAIGRTRELMAAIGQAPITMRREIDGFVVNRLQGALLHEAFRLVANGYASVADVDRAIADGLGLRWSFMGPFETIDLNAPGGVRDYVARYESLYRTVAATQTEPCAWSGALVDEIERQRDSALPRSDLAERQAWRDRRLMALAAHKKTSDQKFGK
jgi:3-hydroxyacyl-CoA dehydrogenase